MQKINYKVYLSDRVKKKVKFFNTETYPLQIRITSGARTLYMKSYFFSVLQQNKYQQGLLRGETDISINAIIQFEEDLMQFILLKQDHQVLLEPLREAYHYFSRDILHELDEIFKQFLVDFFYAENLVAYSQFIKHDGSNYTSEFILDNLERSLRPEVYRKLLYTAIKKTSPYIPFIRFFRKESSNRLPVFPVYQWQQNTIAQNFALFVHQTFPEYEQVDPAEYINQLLAKASPDESWRL